MSANQNNSNKPMVEIQIPTEVTETKGVTKAGGESTNSGVIEDVPTISTLLQRKKMNPLKPKGVPILPPELPSRAADTQSGVNISDKANEASHPTITTSNSKIPVQPVLIRPERAAINAPNREGNAPTFRKKLLLDALDLASLKRLLKFDKKNDAQKKLHVFGFFSTLFSEVAYFDLDAPSQEFYGVMGYGTPSIVGDVRQARLDIKNAPSIFGVVATGKPFCGNVNALRAEDVALLKSFGFSVTATLALFPVVKKSFFGKAKIQGFVLATSPKDVEIDPKEAKQISSALKNLNLLP